VSVKGRVQRIMAVFSDVQHSGTKIFGTLRRFKRQQLKQPASCWVVDGVKGAHQGARRRCIHIETKALRSLREGRLMNRSSKEVRSLLISATYQASLDGGIMPAKQCLFRQVNSNMLANDNVGQQHELQKSH